MRGVICLPTEIASRRLEAASLLLGAGSKFLDPVALLIGQAIHALRGGECPSALFTELEAIDAALTELQATLRRGEAPLTRLAWEEQLIRLFHQTKECLESLDPQQREKKRRQILRLVIPSFLLVLCYVFGVLLTRGEFDPSKWILPRYQGLRIIRAEQSSGQLGLNRSVAGGALRANGMTFLRGIGTHAYSRILLRLDGKVKRVSGLCGVDMAVRTRGSILCRIVLQPSGKEIFASGKLQGGMPPVPFDLELADADRVELIIEDSGDGIADDQANWFDLNFY